jgi:bla regulator protein BlaR1
MSRRYTDASRATGTMLMAAVRMLPLSIHAQTAPAPPKFEVASVKPNNSDQRPRGFNLQPGGQQLTATVTVKSLIQQAYGLRDFQISGGPGWIKSDLFDINAKSENPVEWDQVILMLQSLLADRFQLVMHRDTKETPVYALVIDKNGPKFIGAKAGSRGMLGTRRGLLIDQAASMGGLAAQLSNVVARIVVDRTGLTGQYDLRLEWRPDEIQVARFQETGVPEGLGAPPPDSPGPSLFTALQEQLGLRLESEKAPMEMLAIDRVEKPSGN